MNADVMEWVHLVGRWVHVIAAIAWIGHAFLFNWLDEALVAPEDDDPREGLEGELFLVHGGGFYHVVKSWQYPERLRGPLHWFYWEAGMTWLSGFFLLVVVYYHGGGIYLLDPSVSDISVVGAASVGVGTLVFGWLVYDLILCRSLLVKSNTAFAAVSIVLVTAVAWGLGQVMSGRAAYIHVGALLGTIMAANVWIRIIPAMRKMVDAAAGGGALDVAQGKAAKHRSKHNNYIVFPLIFIMVSNHYPGAYAHGRAWAVLAGLMVLGGVVKHAMNLRGERIGIAIAVIAIPVGAIFLTVGDRASVPAPAPEPVVGAQPVDPAQTGTVRGRVVFDGIAPPPAELSLYGGCEDGHDGPVFDESLLVRDGALANAFVWVPGAEASWDPGAPPADEVVVDQVGCIYAPRVVGARVGQPVPFVNSDALLHNVRAVTEVNATFNDMMPQKDQRITKTFLRPDVMLQARCDIHPWMRAYVGVVPHPWFAVSDEAGGFVIDGLPAGRWELEAWHETLGVQRAVVTVAPGAVVEPVFSFSSP